MFHFLEYPFSRGETHIVSPDPYEAPDFDAGFMNDERDMAPMVWGYIKSSKPSPINHTSIQSNISRRRDCPPHGGLCR